MRPRDEAGSAFVVALFLLAVLAMLGMGVVATATSDLKVSDSYARSIRNLYAADAGANHAVAMLQSDPSTGNMTPYPNGTPLTTGRLGQNTYSIWLWNQRLTGSGATIDFDSPESRQFVVEGKDDKGGIRKIQGIIEPARQAPAALERAVFTCQNANLINGGEVEGNVYAKGNVSFGAKCVQTVNVETRGDLTTTQKVTGYGYANGTIHNNAQPVNGACRTAMAAVDKPSNCKGGVTANVSPAPVKDYCNNGSADWDPNMINFTSDNVADVKSRTPVGNQHLAGWSSGSAIALGDDNYYVNGGSAVWTGNTITYTGNTVLIVDGGYDFTCSDCIIKMAGGAPKSSNITILTSAGDILFTSSTNKSMTVFGVLWAGVTDPLGVLPAKGTVTVSGKCYLELKGEVVALGGPVTVSGGNAKLDAQYNAAKPPVFGDLQGYAITEWLETR